MDKPTTEPQETLPTWLIPDRATTLALKRENLHRTYENALDGILNRMVEQHTTFADAVRDDPRGFEPAHLLQWIMRDEARKMRYYEAQAATAELVFDDTLRIADAADSFEDVQRSTLKVNTRKWWLAVVNRKRFGDTKQIEQNVTIDIGEAMAQAQARVDQSRTIDVAARTITDV
jgi:hypothetical protein